MRKGITMCQIKGSSTEFRGMLGLSYELFKHEKASLKKCLSEWCARSYFWVSPCYKAYPPNNQWVCFPDSTRRAPPSHVLCVSLPAVRWPPVTTTGYKGWGTSSSRPGRRKTLRTIGTSTASTSPGWVFDRSHQSGTELHRHGKHMVQNTLESELLERFPLMHHWTLRLSPKPPAD